MEVQLSVEKTKIYWNNVCLLSKMEEEFVRETCNQLSNQTGVSIDFEFFGLGRPLKLRHKIAKDLEEGGVRADALVSTDLDVFQDSEYLLARLHEYRNLNNVFPIARERVSHNIFYEEGQIQPALVIPLVMAINTALISEGEAPTSLQELTTEKWKGKITFGGMDTSAGRSVLMTLWYLYGEDAVRQFIINSTAQSVPAAAFNAVMRGHFGIGIVPSIFAIRQGVGNVIGVWPKEGAIAIPTYVAVKQDASDSAMAFLKECLYSGKVQSFYSQRGYIIPVLPEAPLPAWLLENQCRTVYPDWNWIKGFDMEKFNALCASVV